MIQTSKALVWAAAILALAAASSVGLVQQQFTQLVLMGAPLVAYFHIYGVRPCGACEEHKA